MRSLIVVIGSLVLLSCERKNSYICHIVYYNGATEDIRVGFTNEPVMVLKGGCLGFDGIRALRCDVQSYKLKKQN